MGGGGGSSIAVKFPMFSGKHINLRKVTKVTNLRKVTKLLTIIMSH